MFSLREYMPSPLVEYVRVGLPDLIEELQNGKGLGKSQVCPTDFDFPMYAYLLDRRDRQVGLCVNIHYPVKEVHNDIGLGFTEPMFIWSLGYHGKRLKKIFACFSPMHAIPSASLSLLWQKLCWLSSATNEGGFHHT